jgi:alpha/beta superfamily hydrolase
MTTQRLKFRGALGNTLVAYLERPENRTRAYALFAHCFTCGKDLKSIVWISRALAEKGVAVLRFDFTGLGESDGEFAETNFSSNLGDIFAAADFLRRRGGAPRVLLGHSLGGAAVIAAATRIPECAAVASIAAPSDLDRMGRDLILRAPGLVSRGEAVVKLGERSFRIKRQLIEDLKGQNMKEAVSGLNRALLIFHAPEDALVPVENAHRLFASARHPKSFVALNGADHLLSRKQDALYVAEILGCFLDRVL